MGIGRATLAPTAVAAELFRLDPLGVLVADGHRFAALPAVPVARLATEPLLFAEEERAPEFNQFVIELCRSVGFTPTLYRGTVGSILASVDLVVAGRVRALRTVLVCADRGRDGVAAVGGSAVPVSVVAVVAGR